MYKYRTFKTKHLFIQSICGFLIAMLIILFSCDNPSDGSIEKAYNGNNKYTIRESTYSLNGKHQISTFVTNDCGVGVIIDGDFKYYNDVTMRYRPVISDDGHYAWAQQLKGRGYEIIWEGHSIIQKDGCLDFLTAGRTKAVCVESDTGHNLTRIFLIDMTNGNSEILAWLKTPEYIEDICQFGNDNFGVITCIFDNSGNKLYNVYVLNGIKGDFVKISENLAYYAFFPKGVSKDCLVVDLIQMSDNDRYLFNALNILNWGGYNCDAFAYGNDFRGRLSWDESERLRGLSELYIKTNKSFIKETIENVVDGLLNARNKYTGISTNPWNPDYLWSSKVYSINFEPACIMAENCEILSGLLYTITEGIIKNDEVVSVAEKAYDYYDQWYKDGHYYLPYGFPTTVDGIVVPWNYQNAMAEVCLDLYVITRDQKYLDRCDELISAFKSEWVLSGDKLLWHYYPQIVYNGWEDDGRSKNTPTSTPQTDNLYEDVGHAGISVRLFKRYIENIPNRVVSNTDIQKIEANMANYCFKDGFARFISGDIDYSPKAWHYWISPCYAYYSNQEYAKYVKQGYLKCFPQWDSQQSLFANAKLYHSNENSSSIHIDRMELKQDNNLIEEQSFYLQGDQIYEYLGIESTQR